jgi:hypothetical protein
MNTLEIDHVLKTHPITRHVFKGVYARNRLPINLSEPSALIWNTDPHDRPETHWVALCTDANSRGEYYDPTGRPPFLRAYVNFMNKHCTSWTYNQSSRRRLHCMRTPLYILSDTQMCRKIQGWCYENIETPERSHRHIVKTCVHRLINKA